MDFADHIRELAAQLKMKRAHVYTEEATKTAMVMPFLQVLGYDIFNPEEVIPEYTADYHGLKKDEKIDYVLAIKKEPSILIEVKNVRSDLPERSSQLLKYFHAMKINFPVRFGILTNGIEYKFFSDFDQKNIMDEFPFLTIKIDEDIRESQIAELRKFHKDQFDPERISVDAWKLKYISILKRYFKKQFKEPDEEFIRFLIREAIPFKIIATKQSIEKFSPIVIDAIRQHINEVVTDRSRTLLKEAQKAEIGISNEELSEKQIKRIRFWTQVLGYAKTKTDLHAKISPNDGGWVGTSARVQGLSFCYSVTKHQATAELYIDKGKDTREENEKIFDKLALTKEDIEMSFGGPLEWERLDGKRACRIKKLITEGGYEDEESWPKIHEAMVNAMIRLHAAISPHIQYLRK